MELHPNDELRSRTLRRARLPWLLVALLALAAPAARAEVTLSTSVVRISSAAGVGAQALSGQALTEVLPGDVLRYTIAFQNTSTQDVAAGSVVITNPLPEGTVYVEGSAAGDRTRVTFSVDGETFGPPEALVVGEGPGTRAADAADYRVIRWTYQPLLAAGETSEVSFELLIP